MAEIVTKADLENAVRELKEYQDSCIRNLALTIEKNIIMTQEMVYKRLHIHPYKLKGYIGQGLRTLPDGKITLYDLNEFLGKHNMAKISVE
jgi:hypothetical protein